MANLLPFLLPYYYDSCLSKKMSLHNERKNSLLDPETISKIWFGNDVKVAAWKKAVQLVERDFILNPNLDIYQLTLREQRNL